MSIVSDLNPYFIFCYCTFVLIGFIFLAAANEERNFHLKFGFLAVIYIPFLFLLLNLGAGNIDNRIVKIVLGIIGWAFGMASFFSFLLAVAICYSIDEVCNKNREFCSQILNRLDPLTRISDFFKKITYFVGWVIVSSLLYYANFTGACLLYFFSNLFTISLLIYLRQSLIVTESLSSLKN